MNCLKSILNLLATNSYTKFLFKCDLRIISFFADNLFNYAFYIFCIFYGFFGCISPNCVLTNSLAAIFVAFLIGLVIQTYILIKIPFTRAYLENLVSKNYIEKYLGKYTGSEATLKLIKYIAPAASLALVEHYTANIVETKNLSAAKLTEENFYFDHQKSGSVPSKEKVLEMRATRDNYIKQAANSTGVISRGFAESGLNKKL